MHRHNVCRVIPSVVNALDVFNVLCCVVVICVVADS